MKLKLLCNEKIVYMEIHTSIHTYKRLKEKNIYKRITEAIFYYNMISWYENAILMYD